MKDRAKNEAKPDLQVTQMAGEFLTAGELFKRGFQVAVTLGNAKAIDLFAENPRTGKTHTVQVKTQRDKNNFPLHKGNIRADCIYVFVRLNAIGKKEEFFIVQGREILHNIDRFYGASYRNPDKISKRPGINYGPLDSYKDNWQVFDE